MLDKTILLTGGTGTFGTAFTQSILQYNPKKLIIFSRDEYKQSLMVKDFPQDNIRFFIGDVRDRERLGRAFEGVDYVVHAAALKQVPALEYNPTEAVKTNIDGANNIISAAIEKGVKKVIALSSDKAVNPINLYGATKLVAEKLFLAANAYGGRKVEFSVIRYGNVIGSRGSVVSYFLDLARKQIKEFPITHPDTTRFWLSKWQAVYLVIEMLSMSCKGEIWIPEIPSMKIIDVAKAIDPDCEFKIIGLRKGEKLHETLISKAEGDEFTSNKNKWWLTKKEFWRLTNENCCNNSSSLNVYTISS